MTALLSPIVFVLIWSTGWVVAKTIAPHADPLTFLGVRYLGAIVLLLPFALFAGAKWPAGRGRWLHALANGALLHGLYLGGVWWAIAHGVPAGISALMAALQPLLTAIAAGPLLGERLDARRWTGIAMGMLGVAAVVAPKLSAPGALGAVALPIAVNVVAMVSVSAATLHQKRALAGMDLRTLAIAQYLGALVVTVPAVLLLENLRIEWTPETLGALAWSVVGLSIFGIVLMLAMIQRGEVSRVAALIFLVPPIAAVQAFLLFDERLSPLQIGGMALAAAGVLLVNARGLPASAEGCIAAEPSEHEDRDQTLRRPA
ncbi:MAG: DMT family transporter [Hansschlegelia sp.]